MLRRMRETKEREVMNKQQSEIDALGEYFYCRYWEQPDEEIK